MRVFLIAFLLSVSEIIVAGLPVRIVSASVAADEILFDLLKNKNRVAAYSPLARSKKYSMVSEKLPLSVNTFRSNIEALVNMKPDLVICASFNKKVFLEKLKSMKIPIIVLRHFSSLSDIHANIRTIASAVGVSPLMLIRQFDAVKKFPLIGKRYLLYGSGGMTAGGNTIFHDALTRAGGKNAAAHINGWLKLNKEASFKIAADYIVTSNLSELKREWALHPLVKMKKIIVVPSAILSSTSHYITHLWKYLYEGR